MFVFVPSAQASTNVVPNPGFEQGGCGAGTPDVCGWKLTNNSGGTCGGAGPCTSTAMNQDTTNVHSGSASLSLFWGTDFSDGVGGVQAETDPAFCAQIGPGAHPASFWYVGDSASMGATFFQGADCTGTAADESLSDGGANAWKQVTGVLVAPAGTRSALFWVGVWATCDYAGGCSAAANFDDLEVEDTVVTTPAISSFTPANGPVGTSVDILGVNFTGATSVAFNGTPASFAVDSDSEIHATVPSGATSGPISVTTPSGSDTSNSAFGVAPTISSFTPTCAPAGASVDILGSGFTGATSVTFAGTGASFTVASDSEIHATVPSGRTFGSISVATLGGTAASSSSFTGPCNTPPIARFTFTCTALTCSFDGRSSSDPDGTIQSYSWSFGDGASGSGQTVSHTYAQATAYSVTLTVTDNGGLTGSESQSFTLIALSARSYKVRGLEKVDLAWSGPSGVSFDVYRNGGVIATVQSSAYTDNLNAKGSGTYAYRVCVPLDSVCSNQVTVSF
jgi:PKD repeat protein